MMADTHVIRVHAPGESAMPALPLFLSAVPAGFPSPADDYIEKKLDLNDYLVRHPAATYFVRVAGDSMTGAGIRHGDLLVVDRSLEPAQGMVVIAMVEGELTVKYLRRRNGVPVLVAGNDAYPPIELREESDFAVWGVVTAVVHTFGR